MAASDLLHAHVVWGRVENSGSCVDTSSGSCENNSERHSLGSHDRKKAREKYTDKVLFKDSSGSPAGSFGYDDSSATRGRVGSQRWADKVSELGNDHEQGDLEHVNEEVMAFQARLDEEGLWSKGAALHEDKQCSPCHYVFSTSGCLKGRDCIFCHLPHTHKGRHRPSKSKRAQFRRFVDILDDLDNKTADELTDTMQIAPAQGSYLPITIRKRTKQQKGVANDSPDFSPSVGDVAPAPTIPPPYPPGSSKTFGARPSLICL